MKRPLVLAMLAACSVPPATTPDGASADPYADLTVDGTHLDTILADMTGYNVLPDGTRIAERYTPASKAKWRAYWTAYMTALGATVNEIDFPVANQVGETTGHDLEAVFPGASPDSIVAIVHYDSTGAPGHEADNPGVDDNMTPMAIQMEAARLLARRSLDHTLRFAATDDEEITTIEGGRAYADHLDAAGVKVIAAIDGELSGWSCWSEGKCSGAADSQIAIVARSCDGTYDSSALGADMADVASRYGTLAPAPDCDSDTDGSELYNFWKRGVPAFYFEEQDNDDNVYFDEFGDDTMAHIDAPYFHAIGQTAAVMIAKLAGLH